MESVKKLLPFLLIAIVFAVGGYFIGQGKLNDQGASLYKSINKDVGTTFYIWNGTECTTWYHLGNGVLSQIGLKDGGEADCHAIMPRNNTHSNPVPTTDVKVNSTAR